MSKDEQDWADMTLEQACETLNRHSYQVRDGHPWQVASDGKNIFQTPYEGLERWKRGDDAIRIARSFELEAELTAAQSHIANWETQYGCDTCGKVAFACYHCHRAFCDAHGAAEHFGQEGNAPQCLIAAQSELATTQTVMGEINAALIEELARVKGEQERDYVDMRKFQAKFMRADHQLRALQDAVEPFVKEARFIIECHLHDAYNVGKIPVKHWRALAAALPAEQGAVGEGRDDG